MRHSKTGNDVVTARCTGGRVGASSSASTLVVLMLDVGTPSELVQKTARAVPRRKALQQLPGLVCSIRESPPCGTLKKVTATTAGSAPVLTALYSFLGCSRNSCPAV